MASLVITVKTKRTQANLQQALQIGANEKKGGIVAIITYFREIMSGLSRGDVTVQTASADPVAATATATLVTVAVGNTVTIGGTTLTASASPASESDFSQAGTDTQDAASLASVINAHSVLSHLVKATSALGVVTITALQSGVVGNQIVISKVGTPITLAPTTALAGGTGGAMDVGTVYLNT